MLHTDIGPKLARAAMVFVRDMMCVKKGESVLVTINTGADMTAVNAIQDAAYLIGAKVSTLILAPRLPFQGGLADAYVSDTVEAAVTTCDAWIDLCMPYMAGCHAHDEAMKNGRTRYVLASDIGADEIVRIFGGADLEADRKGRRQDRAGDQCRRYGPDLHPGPDQGICPFQGGQAGGVLHPRNRRLPARDRDRERPVRHQRRAA